MKKSKNHAVQDAQMPRAQGRAGAAIFCFAWLKKSWTGFFNSLLDNFYNERGWYGHGQH